MFSFSKSKKGAKIETLEQAIKHIQKLEEGMKKALSKIEQLEKKSNFSFQKFNLVRFNPFEGMGGDQSFSLCMLDKDDNGFVITSIFTKNGTRIFAKPVEKGTSTYELSDEEKQSITKAKK